jgi:chemotaxis protein MotB
MASKDGKKIVIVRKKKVVGGGHHGGSWKVAYADFVTAMMAFFMVMWILGMDENMKKAIEGYFTNPVGYKKGYSSGSSPISVGSSPSKVTSAQVRLIVRNYEERRFTQIEQHIRARLEGSKELKGLAAQVEVVKTKDGLRIELIEGEAGDTFFPIGSATMRPAGAIALTLIAQELAGLSNPVVIEGHTDAAPYSTDATYTNWELSADRANAARRVLEAAGMASRRIAQVRGLADTEPRVPEHPESSANRRITVLLPFTNVPEVREQETPART